MNDNVVLYGGAFDPFHNGHAYVISSIKQLGFKKIILIPTGKSPFKKKLSSSKHRLEIINKSLDINVEINDYEIQNKKTSFTIDTVDYFKKKYPNLSLIIGEDSLHSFKEWKSWELIIQQVKILIVSRLDGQAFKSFTGEKQFNFKKNIDDFIKGEPPSSFYFKGSGYEVSSTELKDAIKSKNFTFCSKHLHKNALDYIKQNDLYSV